ncbi:MAG: ferredoxin [Asgard group archaeon]|nr:ferredoxin [Asgard group archaeon]
MTRYTIKIDRTNCIQCGSCYEIDPNHYEADDAFTSYVRDGETTMESSTGTFDDDKISLAKEAAEACPTGVITVEEVD